MKNITKQVNYVVEMKQDIESVVMDYSDRIMNDDEIDALDFEAIFMSVFPRLAAEFFHKFKYDRDVFLKAMGVTYDRVLLDESEQDDD